MTNGLFCLYSGTPADGLRRTVDAIHQRPRSRERNERVHVEREGGVNSLQLSFSYFAGLQVSGNSEDVCEPVPDQSIRPDAVPPGPIDDRLITPPPPSGSTNAHRVVSPTAARYVSHISGRIPTCGLVNLAFTALTALISYQRWISPIPTERTATSRPRELYSALALPVAPGIDGPILSHESVKPLHFGQALRATNRCSVRLPSTLKLLAVARLLSKIPALAKP